jgi:hypothetical protein
LCAVANHGLAQLIFQCVFFDLPQTGSVRPRPAPGSTYDDVSLEQLWEVNVGNRISGIG